jgi:hypothetical protein
MDRRTWQDPLNYSRETGTERRALRSRGDRRRYNRALRLFFIPMSLLMQKLRTRSLSI